MRLSNGFVIDKEKTFGELKFTAVRDVFLQNEDGTPSTQLKKRIYDLKCSLHGGIIPVSVPPEVPLLSMTLPHFWKHSLSYTRQLRKKSLCYPLLSLLLFPK